TIDKLDNEDYHHNKTPDEVKETVGSGEGEFVYFWSPTCVHCEAATPFLMDAFNSEDQDITQLNVLEYQQAWQDYQIEATPTFIYFEDDEEVDRFTGNPGTSEDNVSFIKAITGEDYMKCIVYERFDSMTLENMHKALHVPKKEMHHLRMSKDIVINDEKKPLDSTLSAGDIVILPDDHGPSSYKPSYRACEILYEDRYLAVLLKPRGVKTHPNEMHETNTLMNHAIYTLDNPYLE